MLGNLGRYLNGDDTSEAKAAYYARQKPQQILLEVSRKDSA